MHEGDGQNITIETSGYDLPIRWTCYSRQCHDVYKPSLLGLVRGVLTARNCGVRARMKDAADVLRRLAGPVDVADALASRDPEARPRVLEMSRDQVRRKLKIPSSSFVSRGFSEEVLDAYDIGYSHKLKRDVVPLYNEDGTVCVGYEARSVRPQCKACRKHHSAGSACRYGQPKWIGMEGFAKGTYTYNLAAARATSCPFIILVEGAPDVLRLAEAGYVAVALLGSDASTAQLEKLASLGKEMWVTLDTDPAGEEARGRLHRRLLADSIRLPTVDFRVPQPYKDPGDTPILELRAAIQSEVDRLKRSYEESVREECPWFYSEYTRVREIERPRLHRAWIEATKGLNCVGPRGF